MRTLHGIIEKRERLRPWVWCILGFADLKWKARYCRPVPSNLPSCPNCWRWTEPLILTAPTTLMEQQKHQGVIVRSWTLEISWIWVFRFFGRLAEDPRIPPGDCSSVQLVSLKASLSVLSATVLHLVTICNPKQKHMLPPNHHLQLAGKVHEDLRSRTPQ